MQYIVMNTPEPDFSKKVMIMLKAGWKLQGGVAVSRLPPGVEAAAACGEDSSEFWNGGVQLFQALTHEDDDAQIPDECRAYFYG